MCLGAENTIIRQFLQREANLGKEEGEICAPVDAIKKNATKQIVCAAEKFLKGKDKEFHVAILYRLKKILRHGCKHGCEEKKEFCRFEKVCRCNSKRRFDLKGSYRDQQESLRDSVTVCVSKLHSDDHSSRNMSTTSTLKQPRTRSRTRYTTLQPTTSTEPTVTVSPEVIHSSSNKPIREFTPEELDSDDFRCKPNLLFKVECNTCWCAANGMEVQMCTRIACNPKVYSK